MLDNSSIRTTNAERAALWVLGIFTVFAVAGFSIFGMHPGLVAATPSASAFYGTAFVLFARGQVVLASAALFYVLIRRTGSRWIPAFALVYLISLSSELSGTTVGLPFGPYQYTDGLGPKWFGHVPLLIPLSWFIMAVPSFAIARRLAGPAASSIVRVLTGSFVLLSWDLALDPAMSHATKYWIWGEGVTGPYYGMPWLNLFGWYVTGVALMLVFAMLRADRWIKDVPIKWLAGFYAANLALSLGIDAGAGLGGAVLASAIPLLACAAVMRAESRAADRPGERAVVR
ncbi:MAG: carotenoid biosynthesis protein [Gemmatimonadaceae bacterium]